MLQSTNNSQNIQFKPFSFICSIFAIVCMVSRIIRMVSQIIGLRVWSLLRTSTSKNFAHTLFFLVCCVKAMTVSWDTWVTANHSNLYIYSPLCPYGVVCWRWPVDLKTHCESLVSSKKNFHRCKSLKPPPRQPRLLIARQTTSREGSY